MKLELIKVFVKALNGDGKALAFIRHFSLTTSAVKTKEDIFVGTDIQKIMKNDRFESILTTDGRKRCLDFIH